MKRFVTRPGLPHPLGAMLVPGGINFALFSRHARQVSLVLFQSGEGPKTAEIRLDPHLHKTGDIWHIHVKDLDPSSRYGYRVHGPWDPDGEGHRFSGDTILLDPYVRALTGGSDWGEEYMRNGAKTPESNFQRRGCIVDSPLDCFNDTGYDWEGDKPLNIPLCDSIIYELHVRGYTVHESSGVNHPGTYAGLVERIPYLQELGVTAVELLPVTEFDENENIHFNPRTGEKLKNYWGYSPLAFFAPKASYAADGRNGRQIFEFREMIKALHQAGIEVILDIVFNHTAEGDDSGPVISFKGLDNTIYYLLDPGDRHYHNYSGCGNTLNCNHPVVRNLIIDCLRYWVMEMHVDGFRFDLASILGRDVDGRLLRNPPLVEHIAEDPILGATKIIAEAWDAAGLYQVGSFSKNPRWAEWNGRYRDDVRAFMCGHEHTVPALATRISGSADLYQRDEEFTPHNSINFITSHDGFTLRDLVSYNEKHNEANGEDNRDGDNHNLSWNSGAEGETADQRINTLRNIRVRSLAAILFLSQGTPMMAAGDEFGRTQKGNNNAYCQDNEISWVDWSLAEKNADLLRFFKHIIALRKKHPAFRRQEFFPASGEGHFPEIKWQGTLPGQPDWSPEARKLAFFLDGRAHKPADSDFFVMMNSDLRPQFFIIHPPRRQYRWVKIIYIACRSPYDIVPEEEAEVCDSNKITVAGMAVVVLISRRP